MILVTGATGNVGREIARQLNERGVKFRILTRKPEKLKALGLTATEVAQGDFDDPASLENALKGVSRVFLNSSSDLRQTELQMNVVKAAQKAGATHIVKLAILGVTSAGSPISVGRIHFQTEEAIKKTALKWTFVHPNMFMQFLLGSASRKIKEEGALYFVMKKAKISLVDTKDVASVAVAALTQDGHEGKTYQITGPEALSFDDVASIMTRVLEKPVKYVDVPQELLKKSMLSVGVPEWLANDMLGIFDVYSKGNDISTQVLPDFKNVTRVQGRTFAQFVRDHAQVFR